MLVLKMEMKRLGVEACCLLGDAVQVMSDDFAREARKVRNGCFPLNAHKVI